MIHETNRVIFPGSEQVIEDTLGVLRIMCRHGRMKTIKDVKLDRARVTLATLKKRMVEFASLARDVQRPTQTITDSAKNGSEIITQNNVGVSEGVDEASGIEDLIVLFNQKLLAELASVFLPSATLVNAQDYLCDVLMYVVQLNLAVSNTIQIQSYVMVAVEDN